MQSSLKRVRDRQGSKQRKQKKGVEVPVGEIIG